jgi:signal peptidase II
MKSLVVALAVAGLAFTVDLLCKWWIEQVLVPHQPVLVVGSFVQLTLGYNTGVAFSLFTNGGVLLLLATAIVIVGLGSWSLRALALGALPPRAAVPIGLVLGGGVGNFLDRLPDGRVTDFVDIGIGAARWPTFNTADMWIVVGMTLLLLMSLSKREPFLAAS